MTNDDQKILDDTRHRIKTFLQLHAEITRQHLDIMKSYGTASTEAQNRMRAALAAIDPKDGIFSSDEISRLQTAIEHFEARHQSIIQETIRRLGVATDYHERFILNGVSPSELDVRMGDIKKPDVAAIIRDLKTAFNKISPKAWRRLGDPAQDYMSRKHAGLVAEASWIAENLGGSLRILYERIYGFDAYMMSREGRATRDEMVRKLKVILINILAYNKRS